MSSEERRRSKTSVLDELRAAPKERWWEDAGVVPARQEHQQTSMEINPRLGRRTLTQSV